MSNNWPWFWAALALAISAYHIVDRIYPPQCECKEAAK